MAARFPCMWGFMASMERFQPTWRCGKSNRQRNRIEVLDSTATNVCTQGIMQVWRPLYATFLGCFSSTVYHNAQSLHAWERGMWLLTLLTLSKLPFRLAGDHVGLLACGISLHHRCSVCGMQVIFLMSGRLQHVCLGGQRGFLAFFTRYTLIFCYETSMQ